MSQSQSSEPTVPQGGFTVQSSKPLLSKGFKVFLWCMGLLLIMGVVYGEVSIYQEIKLLERQVWVISEEQKENQSPSKDNMSELKGEIQGVEQEILLLKREHISLQSEVEAVKERVGLLIGQQQTQLLTENSEDEEEVDTSKWQVYRNEKYGYEVKYPPEWTGGEDSAKTEVASFRPNGEIDAGQAGFGIYVYESPTDFTPKEWWEKTYKKGTAVYIYKGTFLISGIRAEVYQEEDGLEYTYYLFLHNSKIYLILSPLIPEKIGQILSTFRFLE